MHRFLEFSITINQRGQIDAFDMKVIPERVAEGAYAGYQDTAKLKLPFNGEWLVYQGGRIPFDNPYAYDDAHRYALDFASLKNGHLFSGSGGIGTSKNEDSYCFGQPVLAPLDGTVTKAVAGYDDNPPGKPTGDPEDGNIIAIRHEEGDTHETVVMNHLKQNSLKVKSGDKVKQGDVVAECGDGSTGPVPHSISSWRSRRGCRCRRHLRTTLPTASRWPRVSRCAASSWGMRRQRRPAASAPAPARHR